MTIKSLTDGELDQALAWAWKNEKNKERYKKLLAECYLDACVLVSSTLDDKKLKARFFDNAAGLRDRFARTILKEIKKATQEQQQ